MIDQRLALWAGPGYLVMTADHPIKQAVEELRRLAASDTAWARRCEHLARELERARTEAALNARHRDEWHAQALALLAQMQAFASAMGVQHG